MRTVFTLATLVLTTGLLQAQAPLRVIASNGVKTFVEALVPAYEKSSGRKTSITYGTSTTLVKNIVGGERFDVVIATAEAVDQISKAGKVTREPVSVLGRREQEVLALLAEGKHSREIAEQLHISLATVEVHRRNIMHKLGLHNVAQLTRYAIRKGLTSL